VYTTSFEYHRAASVEEAVRLLSLHGDDAKLLAGGHSLIPLMKLRLARPAHLIDIARAPELQGIREESGRLVVGAATTHRALASSAAVRRSLPMLAEAAAGIGDVQVRGRGTIGGSLAHADPAADLPAVVLALDAELVAVGVGGERIIPAEGFFQGLMATALGPDEVLREIRFPLPPPRTGSAYVKHEHPASRYALVGVAAVLELDAAGPVGRARVALTGVGTRAVRAGAVERALGGLEPTDATLGAAADRATDGLELHADRSGPVEYRRNLVRVYTHRALEAALARARAG